MALRCILYLILKEKIVRFSVTPANIHDIKLVIDMMKDIKAKLIGDKGYI